MRERSMGRAFGLWVSVGVVLALIVSTEVLLAYRASDASSDRHATTLTFASELRARADRELNSVLYLSSGLAGYFVVRHEKIDRREINAILEAVYAQARHIRNLAVAVGYRTAFVYPLVGNEQVLGRDYRNIPGQWPIINRAIETGGGVLTGPVELVQGGTALIYRVPIFVKDRYWGLLSTVIDMPSFQEAAFRGLEAERFEFAIRSVESLPSAGGLLWGDEALFSDPAAIRMEAEVPGGKWIYAVRSNQADDGFMHWAIRVFGWLFASLAGFCVFTVLRQRNELARHAGVDGLTELPNRRLFDDRLEQSIRRQARAGCGQIAVLFIDLDHFKPINDLYGHKLGDRVLRIVARRIRDEVRMADTVARWGGDEFVVVVEDADEALVAQLIERLRQQIAVPFSIKGVTLSVGAAIGAAFYPAEAASAEPLLELADQRMFADKERNKASDIRR